MVPTETAAAAGLADRRSGIGWVRTLPSVQERESWGFLRFPSKVANILWVVSDDIGRERVALEPELIETRRELHRHPELAFAEHGTAALVVERLRALGYEPRTGVGGTGVIADLEGRRPWRDIVDPG